MHIALEILANRLTFNKVHTSTSKCAHLRDVAGYWYARRWPANAYSQPREVTLAAQALIYAAHAVVSPRPALCAQPYSSNRCI